MWLQSHTGQSLYPKFICAALFLRHKRGSNPMPIHRMRQVSLCSICTYALEQVPACTRAYAHRHAYVYIYIHVYIYVYICIYVSSAQTISHTRHHYTSTQEAAAATTLHYLQRLTGDLFLKYLEKPPLEEAKT